MQNRTLKIIRNNVILSVILIILFIVIGVMPYFIGLAGAAIMGDTEALITYGLSAPGILVAFFAGIFGCLFTPNSPILGASGAIFAVEIAFAMFFPNTTVIFYIFPIKAKYLVMIFAGITIFNCLVPTGGNVAHFAHLGGLLYGFLFIRYEPRFTNFLISWQNQQREKEYEKEGEIKNGVDALLDKVNRTGMKSLTRRERSYLRNASKRYRKMHNK